jgi:hypothetical protein
MLYLLKNKINLMSISCVSISYESDKEEVEQKEKNVRLPLAAWFFPS